MRMNALHSPIVKGMIILWSGAIDDLPAGWAYCDGTLGTPNLKNRFVVGASAAKPVDGTGGANSHNHTFTSDVHYHGIPLEQGLNAGTDFQSENYTGSEAVTGTTNSESHLPLWYALAYIMKL